MPSITRIFVFLLLYLSLTACMQTELGGSVAGTRVTIRELRTDAIAQDGLVSGDLENYLADNSLEEWEALSDFSKMANLGNFNADDANFVEERWYLVIARIGNDMDRNSDGAVEDPFTPVAGTWHAIMNGSQLQRGAFMISALTEAVYQSVKKDIPQLDDSQLSARLNQAVQSILADVNNDQVVSYVDVLSYTVLLHKDLYLLDYQAVQDLIDAISDGAGEDVVEAMAMAVMGEEAIDPLQFFTDNISMPIVQAKCINCHTSNGIAPARGARLILVTNSNSNHLNLNHQAFIDLGDALGNTDLSDYVAAKASGQRGHGGGQQLPPGSQDLLNLETYLNMIE